jgi:hypothetical protein
MHKSECGHPAFRSGPLEPGENRSQTFATNEAKESSRTMNVKTEIDRVSRYGQQLEQLFAQREFRISGDRDMLIVGYWSLLLDYHVAVVTLLAKELYGAAFALMRPIVEAWVRVHVVKMGSDAVMRQIKNDKYKVSFDRVGKEIDKAFGLEFFEKSLSKAVRDALHSYTHSGGFQIARRFDENMMKSRYSDGAILNVIEASTTAVFMATIVVAKHFGFEEEWRATSELFSEYNKRPLEVPR